ncbi:MAG: cation diffusion facilitator family transporter [Roseiarcus sp.]|jgi:ferrous-iron efflux pump FieF|uniref:cation diffusion facilitator family transporter n=1 Tax=Roseiarcus sp. TaxID=1969460 RepID=UPI003BB002EA
MRMIPDDPEQARRASVIKSVSTRVTLIVAILLSIGKLAGWLLTGSMVLLASAIDALVDTGASVVTLLGVRYAEQPPDRDHRFGHGKGEAVAAFTQASFLAGAAVVLTFQSIQRLVSPVSLDALEIGVWLIGASLLAALGLVAMQTWAVQRTGSTAIAADRAHYLADIALNAAVLLALGLTHWTGWTRADPAFALVISAYMLRNAYAIAREALEQLLDQELPAQDRRRIKDAVRACVGVRDIHDLRTRFSGDRTFVEYHLEVDPGLTVEIGHAIGDATETAVQNLLPGTVEATAHIEPHGIEDERLDDAVAQKSSAPPRG